MHRFLGKTKVTENISLPDLIKEKTKFSEVFIQSNEIEASLQSGTYFLYCKLPLSILLMKSFNSVFDPRCSFV